MELSENVQLIETKYGKISQSPDEFAWDQRYRPTTIDECILPAADKEIMRGFIKSGRIDNIEHYKRVDEAVLAAHRGLVLDAREAGNKVNESESKKLLDNAADNVVATLINGTFA